MEIKIKCAIVRRRGRFGDCIELGDVAKGVQTLPHQDFSKLLIGRGAVSSRIWKLLKKPRKRDRALGSFQGPRDPVEHGYCNGVNPPTGKTCTTLCLAFARAIYERHRHRDCHMSKFVGPQTISVILLPSCSCGMTFAEPTYEPPLTSSLQQAPSWLSRSSRPLAFMTPRRAGSPRTTDPPKISDRVSLRSVDQFLTGHGAGNPLICPTAPGPRFGFIICPRDRAEGPS